MSKEETSTEGIEEELEDENLLFIRPLHETVQREVAKQDLLAAQGPLFTRETRAFVYQLSSRPIKRMLDFDFLCQREKPSVAGIIQPNATITHQAMQFGPHELKIPIFSSIAAAAAACPDVTILIDYAPKAAVYPTALAALNTPTIRMVVITSEGVPERDVQKLVYTAEKKNKVLIGPGTVGGIAAGAFKIGDTSGTAENAIMCKLYRSGSIGAVCRSSGMLNELCYILSKDTDGLAEGIVVGSYPFLCSSMLGHVLRLQKNPNVKIIVVIGEPSGVGEYEIAAAVKEGVITKPIIGWVLGNCGEDIVPVDLRYGRSSTVPPSSVESATAKLNYMRGTSFIVPESFDRLGPTIAEVYNRLVISGELVPATDSPSQFVTSLPPREQQPNGRDTSTQGQYCSIIVPDAKQSSKPKIKIPPRPTKAPPLPPKPSAAPLSTPASGSDSKEKVPETKAGM